MLDIDKSGQLFLLRTDETKFLSNPGYSTIGKIKLIGSEIGDILELFTNDDCLGSATETKTTIADETFFDVSFTNGTNDFSIKKNNESCISKVTYKKSYFENFMTLSSESNTLTATWERPKYIEDSIDFSIKLYPGNIDIDTSNLTHTFSNLGPYTYKVKATTIDKDLQEIIISGIGRVRPFREIIAGGGYSFTPSQMINVFAQYGDSCSFAILKEDKTIYSWGGGTNYGGLNTNIPGSNYIAVAANGAVGSDTRYGLGAYAALKEDGTIYTWGNSAYGGLSANIPGSNYIAITSNRYAFAALKEDGSIYSWGNASYGGDGDIEGPFTLVTGNNSGSFAALKNDGNIYSWGNSTTGGIGAIDGNFINIVGAGSAFAALKKDKSIHSWGNASYGGTGDIDGSYMAIVSTGGAFAALTDNGDIYSWGSSVYGGNGPVPGPFVSIAGSGAGFAGIKEDGSIYVWGGSFGTPPTTGSFVQVVGNNNSFAAIRNDGNIYTWGASFYGGRNAYIAGSNYISITPNHNGFAALHENGSIFAWGGDACSNLGTLSL